MKGGWQLTQFPEAEEDAAGDCAAGLDQSATTHVFSYLSFAFRFQKGEMGGIEFLGIRLDGILRDYRGNNR